MSPLSDSVEFEEDDWEMPEIRPRDPADHYDEKGDCCWDKARFIGELSRSRMIGTKIVELSPARFRLCNHHARLFAASDPTASIHPLKERRL